MVVVIQVRGVAVLWYGDHCGSFQAHGSQRLVQVAGKWISQLVCAAAYYTARYPFWPWRFSFIHVEEGFVHFPRRDGDICDITAIPSQADKASRIGSIEAYKERIQCVSQCKARVYHSSRFLPGALSLPHAASSDQSETRPAHDTTLCKSHSMPHNIQSSLIQITPSYLPTPAPLCTG